MANNPESEIKKVARGPKVDLQQRLLRFATENKQRLIQVLGGIGGVIALGLAYYFVIHRPNETKASEALSLATQALYADSTDLALNGNMSQMGLLGIIEEYPYTKASNLAQYYSGIAYSELGNPAEAIAHLDEFDSDDGVLSSLALSLIGDAYVELDQLKDAQDYYVKASNDQPNSFLTPFFLRKAATVAEMNEDYLSALSYYQRIKRDFPNNEDYDEIEKLIGYYEAKINNQ